MNLRRLWAVARKESLHIRRDPRSLGLAIGIPMLMILLFGYALTLDVDESTGAVEARIDARSLKLRGAVVDGRVDAGRISAGDTRTIEGNTTDDVLDARRHPSIRFAGKIARATASGGHVVEGALTLRGVTRPLTLTTERSGDVETGEVALEQTDFGIKPFRAMLGALRVRSRIVIKVRLTAGS